MATTALSVTEFVRGFSGVLDRAASGGESFILLRRRKPVAELRPIPAGRLLGELNAVLRSLPALTEEEAEAFGADIAEARSRLPKEG